MKIPSFIKTVPKLKVLKHLAGSLRNGLVELLIDFEHVATRKQVNALNRKLDQVIRTMHHPKYRR